ncbi:hypothetical protein Cadr_000031122 [Camelus dromedarius]|uniref:Uncharacterized protein n=1 Tax=Camelus dromedarius TaxID=9838 RepID=A0A5N4C0D6_CAMDR|nr:hypothetical protein Cadr_000031122 [Camelus dromedarius]
MPCPEQGDCVLSRPLGGNVGLWETQGDFLTGAPGDHACKDHPHGMAKETVVPRSPSDEFVRLPGVTWGHVGFCGQHVGPALRDGLHKEGPALLMMAPNTCRETAPRAPGEADLSPLRPRGHVAQVPPVYPGPAEPQSSGTTWGVVVSGQKRPREGAYSGAEATLQGCWIWQQCTASELPWAGFPSCGMEGPLLPAVQCGELDPSSMSALKMEAALPAFLERKIRPLQPRSLSVAPGVVFLLGDRILTNTCVFVGYYSLTIWEAGVFRAVLGSVPAGGCKPQLPERGTRPPPARDRRKGTSGPQAGLAQCGSCAVGVESCLRGLCARLHYGLRFHKKAPGILTGQIKPPPSGWNHQELSTCNRDSSWCGERGSGAGEGSGCSEGVLGETTEDGTHHPHPISQIPSPANKGLLYTLSPWLSCKTAPNPASGTPALPPLLGQIPSSWKLPSSVISSPTADLADLHFRCPNWPAMRAWAQSSILPTGSLGPRPAAPLSTCCSVFFLPPHGFARHRAGQCSYTRWRTGRPLLGGEPQEPTLEGQSEEMVETQDGVLESSRRGWWGRWGPGAPWGPRGRAASPGGAGTSPKLG